MLRNIRVSPPLRVVNGPAGIVISQEPITSTEATNTENYPVVRNGGGYGLTWPIPSSPADGVQRARIYPGEIVYGVINISAQITANISNSMAYGTAAPAFYPSANGYSPISGTTQTIPSGFDPQRDYYESRQITLASGTTTDTQHTSLHFRYINNSNYIILVYPAVSNSPWAWAVTRWSVMGVVVGRQPGFPVYGIDGIYPVGPDGSPFTPPPTITAPGTP